jgi:uncharacterized protein (DUF2164 family)
VRAELSICRTDSKAEATKWTDGQTNRKTVTLVKKESMLLAKAAFEFLQSNLEKESMLLAKTALEFLQSNLGNCYHNSHVRGASE